MDQAHRYKIESSIHLLKSARSAVFAILLISFRMVLVGPEQTQAVYRFARFYQQEMPLFLELPLLALFVLQAVVSCKLFLDCRNLSRLERELDQANAKQAACQQCN